MDLGACERHFKALGRRSRVAKHALQLRFDVATTTQLALDCGMVAALDTATGGDGEATLQHVITSVTGVDRTCLLHDLLRIVLQLTS